MSGESTSALFDVWAQTRDERARDELISRHLPLARKLASRYARPGEQLEDLVQVASVGLIKAVERFDPARGVAFSSFAVPTILGELKRHFRDTGWAVHVDRATQELTGAMQEARRTLLDSGREATVPALAAEMGCSAAEVVEALLASGARTAVSFDAPAGGQPDSGEAVPALLAETVGRSDALLEAVPDRVALDSALRHLPRLERLILHLRFNEDLSQREIADQVGISQVHVSRLLRRSLGELKALVTAR